MKVLEGAPMIRLMLAVAVFVACADTASAGLRTARWRARLSLRRVFWGGERGLGDGRACWVRGRFF